MHCITKAFKNLATPFHFTVCHILHFSVLRDVSLSFRDANLSKWVVCTLLGNKSALTSKILIQTDPVLCQSVDQCREHVVQVEFGRRQGPFAGKSNFKFRATCFADSRPVSLSLAVRVYPSPLCPTGAQSHHG